MVISYMAIAALVGAAWFLLTAGLGLRYRLLEVWRWTISDLQKWT